MAIIKPIKGNILDIGASIELPEKDKPIEFKKVRKAVAKKIAEKLAAEG